MVDQEKDGPLVSMDLKEFVMTVGARSPAPGGGSVSALVATLVKYIFVCGNVLGFSFFLGENFNSY